MKERTRREEEVKSCKRLQKQWRGRKKIDKAKEYREKEYAATVMQSHVRKKLMSQRYIKIQTTRHDAVTSIQAAVRGMKDRMRREKEVKSSKRLQRQWRGRLAWKEKNRIRQKIDEAKEYREKEYAATVMQSHVRKKLMSQRYIKIQTTRHDAVTSIQAAVRGMKERTRREEEVKSCKRLQKQWRGRKKIDKAKEYREKNHIAKVFQKRLHGKALKMAVMKEKEAVQFLDDLIPFKGFDFAFKTDDEKLPPDKMPKYSDLNDFEDFPVNVETEYTTFGEEGVETEFDETEFRERQKELDDSVFSSQKESDSQSGDAILSQAFSDYFLEESDRNKICQSRRRIALPPLLPSVKE
eukprot:g5179.t1